MPTTPLVSSSPEDHTADFEIGPGAAKAYARLNYKMWFALAEFVDNSTQSRINYGGIIDDVHAAEATILKVEIDYDKVNRVITIKDNCIGMTRTDLVNALKVAQRTVDSVGRSKYGMGMKTAACWIGPHWSVRTCEWDSGEEWTAEVDVDAVSDRGAKIPLQWREVPKDQHYTIVTIKNVRRHIQKRTEENIIQFLGSMYRYDLKNKRLLLLFNGNPILPPMEELTFARLPDNTEAREEFTTTIGGKPVTGWFGVLETGGRKYGGFSLFQNERQIRGYPEGWKPKSVFGGEIDEGGNSLVSQRLTGEICMDGFEVSHTKDEILYNNSEEEELEQFLATATEKLKRYATTMRKAGRAGSGRTPWDIERAKDLAREMGKEFNAPETSDATKLILPPIDVLKNSSQRQSETITDDEVVETFQLEDLKVRLCFSSKSENDPHLTIYPPQKGHLDVIVNQLHPYYSEIDNPERVDELVRQFIYDGIAEYFVQEKTSRREPDAIRKLKDNLLRAKLTRLQNENAASQEFELSKLSDVTGQPKTNT